jgi:hypothetical protein
MVSTGSEPLSRCEMIGGSRVDELVCHAGRGPGGIGVWDHVLDTLKRNRGKKDPGFRMRDLGQWVCFDVVLGFWVHTV